MSELQSQPETCPPPADSQAPVPIATAALPEFAVIDAAAPERPWVEAQIATVFAKIYGAQISHFLPHLLTVSDDGALRAVAGFCGAGSQPLSLERYFDQPVEQMLAAVVRQPILRSSICEIGNLVATRPGSSLTLFVILTAILFRQGYEWTVFTATGDVRKLLQRMGLELRTLCRADAQRMGTELASWGTYYATMPMVMGINVRAAHAVLAAEPPFAGLLTACEQWLPDPASAELSV